MRSYPRNSPQAAARIVALAMFADSHLSNTEWQALRRTAALNRLGLAPDQWDQVIEECCHDLLAQGHVSWDRNCRVDEHTLRQVMAEVDDPELGRFIAWTCGVVVVADGVITEGEWLVLRAALRQWGLPPKLMPLLGYRMRS